MDSVSQIAVLSSSSIQYLEKGDQQTAIDGFSHALKLSKQWLDRVEREIDAHYSNDQHDDLGMDDSECDSFDERGEPTSCCTPVLRLDQCMASFKLPQLSAATANDGIHMYNQPIRLPVSFFAKLRHQHEQQCTDSQSTLRSLYSMKKNAVIMCATSMFNLALSCQLSARRIRQQLQHHHHQQQHQQQQQAQFIHMYTSLLQKAAHLYEWSYQLLVSERMENSGMIVYTLATMNNLGWIQQSLGRYEQSHGSFQNVLSTLVFLVDQHQMRHQQSSGTDSSTVAYQPRSTHPQQQPSTRSKSNGAGALSRKLDGFWCNTSHLILRHTGAPAA